MSPTLEELSKYLEQKGMSLPSDTLSMTRWSTGGKLSFADFLDIMHTHSVKEKVTTEVMDAFRASDWGRTGSLSVADLKHYLMRCGEALDRKEVESLLREINANPTNHSLVKYEDLVRIICSPIPDY